jgi:inosine/xanthosine triphosphatase
MKWAVGTANRAKVECVRSVVDRAFPAGGDAGDDDGGGDASGADRHTFIAMAVESGISAQPMTGDETMRGAFNRATNALAAEPTADFGVGLEGGLEQVGGRNFECGWICVIEAGAGGRVGWGSSARFEMSDKILGKMAAEGKELGEVMDELSGGSDVRQGLGAMGVLTGGHLGRAEAYAHGLLFALAPFLSSRELYWDAAAAAPQPQ